MTIRVKESPIKPVWAFGKPFKRVGRINQFQKRDEAHRLMAMTIGLTWDALPCQGFMEKDRARLIEHWGTDTLGIIRACGGFGIKVEFSIQAGSFAVRLLKTPQAPVEGVGKKVGESLSAKQQEILDLVRDDPRISAKRIASKIGISTRKTEDHLRKLQIVGFLRRAGPRRRVFPLYTPRVDQANCPAIIDTRRPSNIGCSDLISNLREMKGKVIKIRKGEKNPLY